MIRYLNHNDIEKGKWDDCIAHSTYETLYPYSWYLDVVSPGWHALVMNDYEMIMPLTWKKKYGLRMLMQPLLTQQLGVFSRMETDPDSVIEFLNSISSKYLLVDICLNRLNSFESKQIRQESRYNFELDISDAGLNPEKAYTENTLRNIHKGKAFSDKPEEITIKDYLDLKFSLIENSRLQRNYFDRLYSRMIELGRAAVFGIRYDGELHTAAVLGNSRSRSIYLNGCSTLTGKEKRGMFVLMDFLIRMNCGEKQIFDFEGSGIPGVARFFKGFGAERTRYPRIMRNPFQLLGINS